MFKKYSKNQIFQIFKCNIDVSITAAFSFFLHFFQYITMLKNTDKSYFTYNYVLEFYYNFGQFLCKNSYEIFLVISTHFDNIYQKKKS